MLRRSRLSLVLLLLAVISFRLATVYTMTGDPSRAEHVSRSTVHPAEVRLSRAGSVRDRLAQHATDGPASSAVVTASGSSRALGDRRQAPRDAGSFPPYWSSLHLTI